MVWQRAEVPVPSYISSNKKMIIALDHHVCSETLLLKNTSWAQELPLQLINLHSYFPLIILVEGINLFKLLPKETNTLQKDI